MCASISFSDLSADSSVVPIAATAAAPNEHPRAVEQAARLSRWFGVPFTVVDGSSGEVLVPADDQPKLDWEYLGQLGRVVARRGRPEFLEDDDPLVLLAIPLEDTDQQTLVGIGTFLIRPPRSNEDLVRIGRFLGTDADDAARWATRQTPISIDALERLAGLVVTQHATQQRVDSLEGEIDKLSGSLGVAYEEISLIYRLTQNLEISRKQEDLGLMALEWLVDIMAFDGIAIQYTPGNDEPHAPGDSPARTSLLTHGNCPLDNASFSRLVAALGLHESRRPLVINRAGDDDPDWPFAEIHQLIIVPVGEGEQVFGWMAAFNHAEGAEFGTVEADLLSSVCAILASHCRNSELYQQQAQLLSGIVRALTSAIDAKDPYTCGHSERVARVAVRLAQELGCSPETVETIYLSGMLHDVGKIGIDDQVLRKPGRLTAAEFEHIKTHARIGHNILRDIKQLDKVLPVVLHHHESWDGSGYPDKLSGEEIPLLARIVAVADSFDAMGSDRPYRKGMPDEKLDEIIRTGAGKQWDAQIVEAFFRARDDIRAIAARHEPDEMADVQQWL